MFENSMNIFTRGMEDSTDGVALTDWMNAVANQFKAIMDEDFVVACDPATLGTASTPLNTAIAGDGFSRDVAVTVKDSNGDAILFNGTLNVAATETTAGDGASNILDSATTMSFVNGVGSVTVEYTGTWAPADTQTLTVSGTIAGVTITNATSVDTIT